MELKPCPFCGWDGSLSINTNSKIVFGSCYGCGARGSVVQYKDRLLDKDIEEAAENWNRRAKFNMVEIDQFSRVGEGEKE